jgi:hypothetical protein
VPVLVLDPVPGLGGIPVLRFLDVRDLFVHTAPPIEGRMVGPRQASKR